MNDRKDPGMKDFQARKEQMGTPPADSAPGIEVLVVELDPRLADVWLAMFRLGQHQFSSAQVACLLRMAYVAGYSDALTESLRGSLFKALGMPVPEAAKTKKRRTK